MIENTYPYFSSNGKKQFVFLSEGPQGAIPKFILLSLMPTNEWNLGFGDWENGHVSDTVVTNNYDALKVMRTVAKATLDFFEEYPESIVVIKPIDEKRKRLYNLLFQKHFEEIDLVFKLIGFINDIGEPYSPKNTYDNFTIRLKLK
jgi:hypothetical protein